MDAVEAEVLETVDVVSDVEGISEKGETDFGPAEEPLYDELDISMITVGGQAVTGESNPYSTTYTAEYTGSKIEPLVAVTASDVTEDDYELSYGDNITVAQGGSVTITAKSGEGEPKLTGGPITVNFGITPFDLSTGERGTTVSATGVAGQEPTVTVTTSAGTLSDSDYDVELKKDADPIEASQIEANDLITVKVTAKAESNFTGSAEGTYTATASTTEPPSGEANKLDLTLDFSSSSFSSSDKSYDDGYFSINSINKIEKSSYNTGGNSTSSSNTGRAIVFKPTTNGELTVKVTAYTSDSNSSKGYNIGYHNVTVADNGEITIDTTLNEQQSVTKEEKEYTFTLDSDGKKQYAIGFSGSMYIKSVIVSEADYIPYPPAPSVKPGPVQAGTSVSLKAPNNAKIYVKEGSEKPDTSESSSDEYTNPITIDTEKTITVVTKVGTKESTPVQYAYTIALPIATTPTLAEGNSSGIYDVAQTIKLTADADSKIYYTEDGKNPKTAEDKKTYTDSGITIDKTKTIKAYAELDGYQESEVVTFNYIITTEAGKTYKLDPQKETEGKVPDTGEDGYGDDICLGDEGYFQVVSAATKDVVGKIGSISNYDISQDAFKNSWPAEAGTLTEDSKVVTITGGSLKSDTLLNAVKINISAKDTATVNVYHAVKSDSATIKVYKDSLNGGGVSEVTSGITGASSAKTAIAKCTITDLTAGTYYIGFSSDGGIIPYMEVIENSGSEDEDEPTSVEAPTLNPNNSSGEYEFDYTPGEVTITPKTEGSKIMYVISTDEELQGTFESITTAEDIYDNGREYEGPLQITETTTIKAMAYYTLKAGDTLKSEDIAVCTYSIKAGAVRSLDKPTANPVSGTAVELGESGTADIELILPNLPEGLTNGKIFYTTDGITEPDTVAEGETKEYNSANKIQINAATTIKAIAATFSEDGVLTGKSPVETFEYTIKIETQPEKVATPTVKPNGGAISANEIITLECDTDGATFKYTLNGEDPRTASNFLTQPTFTLEEYAGRTVTLKAIAEKNGMEPSDLLEKEFIVSSSSNDGDDDDWQLQEDIKNFKEKYGKEPKDLWIAGIDDLDWEYTGTKIVLPVRVYNNTTLLTEKVDYTIAYKNNINATKPDTPAAKLPTITVTGKGNYSGKATETFTINPLDIETYGGEWYYHETSVEDNLVLYATGKAQKPVPAVTCFMDPQYDAFEGTRKLKNKTDFTVAYYKADDIEKKESDSVTDAGDYVIKLTGNGNYTGTREVDLKLVDKNEYTLVSKLSIKVAAVNYDAETAKTEEGIKTTVTVKNGKADLTEGTDYDLEYDGNHSSGTGYVTVSAHEGSKLIGSKTVSFKINGKPISKAKFSVKTEYTDTTSADYVNWMDAPTLNADYQGTSLELGTDYEVYSWTQTKGKVMITIQGIGEYSGTVKKTFKLALRDLDEGTGTDAKFEYEYDDSPTFEKAGVKPSITITYLPEDYELEQGRDYTVSYKNNKAVATKDATKAPTIVIKGKGDFKGTINKTFEIKAKDIADVEFSMPDMAVNAGGKYAGKPVLTDGGTKLAAGKDYEKKLTYTVDGQEIDAAKYTTAEPGTTIKVEAKAVEGGSYTGTITAEYEIRELDFSKAKVKLAKGVKKYYQDGAPVELGKEDLVVTVGTTTLALVDDVDSETDGYAIVGYTNNNKKGTAKVTIKGTGKYAGTKTLSFKIQAQTIKLFAK